MYLPNQTDNSDSARIRAVEVSHISELIRIGVETNLSPWTAQSYLDEMKNPDAIMLRLFGEDNTIAGFVVGRLVSGGEIDTQGDAEIYNIAVTKGQQRKGLGQLLFNAFISICKESGVANIWLEVRESNYEAIAFYIKNGFEHFQTRNLFYDNPREHALLMKLSLK
ncbi:MAG: ribosomal protein S18-alanine N-acetyltransferase [Pyrinomonadaceae bacterium]